MGFSAGKTQQQNLDLPQVPKQIQGHDPKEKPGKAEQGRKKLPVKTIWLTASMEIHTNPPSTAPPGSAGAKGAGMKN